VKKSLKISCLGCGGLTLLVVLSFVALGLITKGSAEFTEATASYQPLTTEEAESSTDLSGADASGEPIETPAAASGRVHLLLSGVDEASIRRCDPGEDMSFNASYNSKSMKVSEAMTEEDDGSWNYVVDMEFSGNGLGRFAGRLLGGRASTMELCLPEDVPIEIVVESAEGSLTAEFGGLWLPSIDVSLSMGSGMVTFNQPLREPAEDFKISTSMGGGYVGGLGNASPAKIDVSTNKGGFTLTDTVHLGGVVLDMSGAWKRDALVRVASESGGSTLIIPRSVRVVGAPDAGPDKDLPESAPTLTFTPDTEFDELTIRRD
jgi:hypothetical protein